MRCMLLMKATKESEAGVIPGPEIFAAMDAFNGEMIKAGVMLGGEGLHPSSAGARLKFGSGKPVVVDGPFAETKELLAGFWILQVKSFEEAIEWASRCPGHDGPEEFEIEVRRIFDLSDFPQEVIDAVPNEREYLAQQAKNASGNTP
ncbi:MAG: YciI family protein [Chlorobi bacterium]|nr:YciI family protein [Chlorobiota bacterium]MBX7217238.1 YciI family protein [Candidatus Kapabacteria bacterium]